LVAGTAAILQAAVLSLLTARQVARAVAVLHLILIVKVRAVPEL
jgi:hypothetical protein